MAAKRKTIYKTSSVIIILIGILILIAGTVITEPAPKHTKVEPTAKQVIKKAETKQKGGRTTTLSFAPESSLASPIVTKQGEIVTLEVYLDPGKNLVSFANLEIRYDPAKLTLVQPDGFISNDALPSLLNGPIYTPGKIEVTMSIGADPKKGLEKTTKIAAISFRATSPTGNNAPTEVSFGPAMQILSLAPEDGASENVFLSGSTALIAIEN